MATNFRVKIAKLAYPSPSFIVLAFQSRLEYHNSDGRVNSADDLPTSLHRKFGELRFSNSGVYEAIKCAQQASSSIGFSLTKQEGLAVASIARDDPSTLPGDDPSPHAH